MKPRSAKAKGTRLEKKIMQYFQAIGWKARKQPGSGIYQGFEHDVFAEHPTYGQIIVECKKRKQPNKTFDRWLGQADMLVVEADYGQPHVYLPWRVFAQLCGVEEQAE